MTYIIGVGHRSGHGKDTFVNYFVEHFNEIYSESMHPLSIRKISWAWKLKETAHQLYAHLGLREPEFYETDEGRELRNVKLPHIDLTPVEIWIKYGSYGVRNQVWDLTWVEWVRHNVTNDVVINADTRFPVEIPYCDYTINLINPRVPNRKGISVDDELAYFNDWTITVINDGTLSQLRQKAVLVCDSIFAK